MLEVLHETINANEEPLFLIQLISVLGAVHWKVVLLNGSPIALLQQPLLESLFQIKCMSWMYRTSAKRKTCKHRRNVTGAAPSCTWPCMTSPVMNSCRIHWAGMHSEQKKVEQSANGSVRVVAYLAGTSKRAHSEITEQLQKTRRENTSRVETPAKRSRVEMNRVRGRKRNRRLSRMCVNFQREG